MFYMEAYFRERGWPLVGKGFGAFYAIALVIGCLGIGNMFQSNQAFAQVLVITGGEASFLLIGAGSSASRWLASLRR